MKSSSVILVMVALATAACVSTQDFGGDAPPPPTDVPPDDPGDGGTIGDETPVPVGTWKWNWINPTPTGRSLYGIGGTSATDIWVAGEGGTVAHWSGATWDVQHTGPDGARYFAIGVKAKNDVWVAGQLDGKIDVVHYDGSSWTESYPFAGGAFGGFSHGPGARLFAFVDWDIQELVAGVWKPTDTSANDVFGPPADVFVASNGEAWAITTGAKILHLPASSSTWQLMGPIAGIPSNIAGLSIAGTGTKLCAFYTGRAAGGAGYLTYDGAAWHVNPIATDPLTLTSDAHGPLSACFDDGSGMLVWDGDLVLASTTEAPGMHSPFDFPNEKLYGAWSPDGTKAFAVGALGALVTRTAGQIEGAEVGPTIRKDLLTVDVGLDGTVVLADASQPDRSSGGDVVFYKDGVLAPYSAFGGLSPPSIPTAVAVIAKDDTWVLANDSSMIGVAHYTGSWGVTRFLQGGPLVGDPLAIWAAAKNDVWVTAREHCPDFDPLPNGACSKTVKGYAWHYDGTTWNPVTVPGNAVLRSIHGSAADDVWFAGDGVLHWDGKALTPVTALKGTFAGVWSSAKGRVWLWGDKAVLWDGTTSTPVEQALHASAEWTTVGIAEARAGDVFVLTKRATGTSLLWFDPSHTKLVEQLSSDLELTTIRGRENELWAVGAGGATLRFAPPIVH